MDDPDTIMEKAEPTQKRIKNIHSTEIYAEFLKRIYSKRTG